MNFAERNGFVEPKSIQKDYIDNSLRNRLYNLTMKFLENAPDLSKMIEYVADKLGYLSVNNSRENTQSFNNAFLYDKEQPWHRPYEIIELIIEAKRMLCKACTYDCNESGRPCDELQWLEVFPKAINSVLIEEKSAYRMVNDIFVSITNENELTSIKQSFETSFIAVNTHMKKALSLYADRINPDYENSIKESISAVESICCIITGEKGATATLGKTLKKLKDNGVIIHGALESAFSQLYGYTSDENGIRHGGIDFKNAPAEDAKYMLVSCSAFINYLLEKYAYIK